MVEHRGSTQLDLAHQSGGTVLALDLRRGRYIHEMYGEVGGGEAWVVCWGRG